MPCWSLDELAFYVLAYDSQNDCFMTMRLVRLNFIRLISKLVTVLVLQYFTFN